MIRNCKILQSHYSVLQIMTKFTQVSIRQMVRYLVEHDDRDIEARIYALMDYLETVGMIRSLRTPVVDSDLWAITAKGKAAAWSEVVKRA